MTEFGLIDQIKGLFSSLPTHGFEGIGDDCAVLPLGDEALVFTSDMLIEDVHFLRSSTSAFDLGYKSLAVNLSDVAAMGVSPVATLLSLSVPKDLMGPFVEEFMRGYHALSKKYNVALIGGDTTASKDRLSINVTAIGRGAAANIKRRAAAQVGDVILVNGMLGESAAGLKDIFEGSCSTPLASVHKLPEPQVSQGAWLGTKPQVHAMMDISDGVASDLRHILKLSGVGAQIELDNIPTSVDLHSALCGGEDYKLLLTASGQDAQLLQDDYMQQFGQPLYNIGVITDSAQMEWLKGGVRQDVDLMGFRHY
ncbi:MAG: thiamine-phosphate kinase [Rikenellaceae bacterium]